MSKKSKKQGHAVPLIIAPEMQAKLDALKARSGLSKADLMRLSIERGMASVEKMFESPAKQAA